jgi:hypothetical protein
MKIRHRGEEVREQLDFEQLVDLCNQVWVEEITAASPNWGRILGVHVRLSELEHLAEAAQELLP